MSSDTIVLKAKERKELGKAVKALRREGIVPANVYERGKDSQAISANFVDITKVYRQAGKHSPIELDVDGKKHLVMIKDVDFNVAKNTIRHVAFHAVKRNEKVEAEVPVKIEGEVPAEKVGLLILQNLDTVQVEALPSSLPEELFVPGEKLVEDGDKVTVADIKVPNGVVILTESDVMVADVQVPKDQIAEANAALEDQKEADQVDSDKGTDETEPAEE